MPRTILYSEFGLVDMIEYLDAFTEIMEMPSILVSGNGFVDVVKNMREKKFPHKDGLDKASPFKKVAFFVTCFMEVSPINQSFPKHKVGDLMEIDNHQNAIFAYQLALDALHGAKFIRNGGDEVTLVNRIKVSRHSHVDIIDALSSAAPKKTDDLTGYFKMTSVLFEQLAYRENPAASYPIR